MAKKSSNKQSERLFEEKLVPAKPGSSELFDVSYDDESKPVECLGMTFPNDEARRAHFIEKLREKLKDPTFRKIEGFPIGSDEDILALSDPPYYTACPNPFVDDILSAWIKTQAHPSITSPTKPRPPFAADITEGKGEHFYNVHTYHTKVPYRAIARFLLHYTQPGDVVLDLFCGTGMMGLALQACSDLVFTSELSPTQPKDKIGKRLAFLVDLSPAATHIAANYNAGCDDESFENECNRIMDDFREECGWMFTTYDPASKKPAPVDYYVWSDVFACPDCGHQIAFWDEGVDEDTGHKTADKDMKCPSCGSVNNRDKYIRVEETYFDDILKATATKQKEKMALIVYRVGKEVRQKEPDKADLEILDRISKELIPNSIPVLRMMHTDKASWGDMHRAGYHLGITHFHQFYYRRSLRAIAWLWSRVNKSPAHLRSRLRWWLQSVGVGHTRLNRYFASSYSQVNRYLKGFLYIAQVRSEVAPWYALKGKITKMSRSRSGESPVAISTSSATRLLLPDDSVDYIFTDPPFGGNIIYSELNFMWEAWFGVFTNQSSEAIVSKSQSKGLSEYHDLMSSAFKEAFRVLKPGKWMTVEFHNSHNAVWMSIQVALEKAGFVVGDVRVFDKKQLTMKQQTAAGAVQKDLIISAYKPDVALDEGFRLQAGTEEVAWEFVRQHLTHLPIISVRADKVEILAERQQHMLFDRMVAFHVQRGCSVPLSASEFYLGLKQRLSEREGMYFLPEQANDFDCGRLEAKGVEQLELFVSDEKGAIQWVRRQLAEKSQKYKDLQPEYMREAQRVWEKHEQPLELMTILEQNFVEEGDGLWRVPDPRKGVDLEQIRHRALMKEFQQYIEAKGKLKVVRTEALRAGFKECWQKKDYTTIVQMAKRVPDAVIQEDSALLMYFDNASLLNGE
jgi:16S rRNA G966 N2-methylase RsmD